MLSEQALDLARRHGYRGPDDPRTDVEEAALATALWAGLEEREGRQLTEWHGIPRGAREIIVKVLTEY